MGGGSRGRDGGRWGLGGSSASIFSSSAGTGGRREGGMGEGAVPQGNGLPAVGSTMVCLGDLRCIRRNRPNRDDRIKLNNFYPT